MKSGDKKEGSGRLKTKSRGRRVSGPVWVNLCSAATLPTHVLDLLLAGFFSKELLLLSRSTPPSLRRLFVVVALLDLLEETFLGNSSLESLEELFGALSISNRHANQVSMSFPGAL